MWKSTLDYLYCITHISHRKRLLLYFLFFIFYICLLAVYQSRYNSHLIEDDEVNARYLILFDSLLLVMSIISLFSGWVFRQFFEKYYLLLNSILFGLTFGWLILAAPAISSHQVFYGINIAICLVLILIDIWAQFYIRPDVISVKGGPNGAHHTPKHRGLPTETPLSANTRRGRYENTNGTPAKSGEKFPKMRTPKSGNKGYSSLVGEGEGDEIDHFASTNATNTNGVTTPVTGLRHIDMEGAVEMVQTAVNPSDVILSDNVGSPIGMIDPSRESHLLGDDTEADMEVGLVRQSVSISNNRRRHSANHGQGNSGGGVSFNLPPNSHRSSSSYSRDQNNSYHTNSNSNSSHHSSSYHSSHHNPAGQEILYLGKLDSLTNYYEKNSNYRVSLAKLPMLPNSDIPTNLSWDTFINLQHLVDSSSCHIYTALWGETPVVVKLIKAERVSMPVAVAEFEMEENILLRIRHPNIIRLLGSGNLPRKFLVLELLSGGSLSHTLGLRPDSQNQTWNKRFSFLETLRLAYDLSKALHYLHNEWCSSIHVIHRDIKPDNIGFTANGSLKIFDFGLCVAVRSQRERSEQYRLTGNTGTLRYMAPEVVRGLSYNQSVDTYSFGILIWQIATGKIPFREMGKKPFFDKVVMGGHRPTLDRNWPSAFGNLLKSCWHEDKGLRPSFYEISIELEAIIKAEEELMHLKEVSCCHFL
jgi:hypothetical protein